VVFNEIWINQSVIFAFSINKQDKTMRESVCTSLYARALCQITDFALKLKQNAFPFYRISGLLCSNAIDKVCGACDFEKGISFRWNLKLWLWQQSSEFHFYLFPLSKASLYKFLLKNCIAKTQARFDERIEPRLSHAKLNADTRCGIA